MTCPTEVEIIWVIKHIDVAYNIIRLNNRINDNLCSQIVDSLEDYDARMILKKRQHSFSITTIEERDRILDISLEAAVVHYSRNNKSVMDKWHKLHDFMMYLYPDSLYINDI